MNISPLNPRSKRYADGHLYPPHWTTKRIRHYLAFIKKHPDPKAGENYFTWYGKLKHWMESAGFK